MKLSLHFKQRLLAGSLGALGLTICLYYSFTPLFKPIFILLNSGVISLALLEYYHLAQSKGFQPHTTLGICAGFAYITAIGFSSPLSMLPLLILLGFLLLSFLISFNQSTAPIANLAITAFGIIYLVLPLSCALRINYFLPEQTLHEGRWWLVYALIISKITDTGAYFCGKTWGKHKLAPYISPKKTIEGALGGIVAGLSASLLFFTVMHGPPFSVVTFAQMVGLGLLISGLAQLGDLSESLLKRDAGVKDSSHLPGLGGVLDVVDSLVFSLPLMYLLLEMGIIGIKVT